MISCWIRTKENYCSLLNLKKQEVFDAFNEIVRSESSYITTLDQVMDFVKFCAADHSKYAFPVIAGVLLTDLPNLKLPKDLLVVIEFED